MRNFFATIELRINDYSSVLHKSLRGQVIGKIGCFERGGTCVRALGVNREHQFCRKWQGPTEAGPRVNRSRVAGNRVVGEMP
jgi:hypothetical protein